MLGDSTPQPEDTEDDDHEKRSATFQQYLDNIQDPRAASALFADDGALEIPYLKSLGMCDRAHRPQQISAFIAALLAKVPDFRLRCILFLIDTPEPAFAEYDVEAPVPATDRVYQQSYAGRLVAVDGHIVAARVHEHPGRNHRFRLARSCPRCLSFFYRQHQGTCPQIGPEYVGQ